MSGDIWTIEKCRETLPDVRVTWQGKIWNASTSGRYNPFAGVWLLDDDGYYTGARFEFSWSAIAHSLNTGNPLIA